MLAMPLPARARTGLVGHDPDDCVAKIVNVKMGTDPFILSRGGGSFGRCPYSYLTGANFMVIVR